MTKTPPVRGVKGLGIRVSPIGLVKKPTVRSAATKRSFTKLSAKVRTVPGGRAAVAWIPRAQKNNKGYIGQDAILCSSCGRGFQEESTCFFKHARTCKGPVGDPLGSFTDAEEIELWVRTNTKDVNAFHEVFAGFSSGYELRTYGFRLEDAPTWLDLGGHIGTFTCQALSRGCDVITFEPDLDNVELLKHNVKSLPSHMGAGSSAPCSACVHHAAAVSSMHRKIGANKNGTMGLLLHPNPDDTYRHTLMSHKNGRDLRNEIRRGSQLWQPSSRVPVFTLKEILQAYPQVTGVKIDIEGSEMELLEEMQESDWGGVTHLVFEYSFEYDWRATRLHKLLKHLKTRFKNVRTNLSLASISKGRKRINLGENRALVIFASTRKFLK